MRLALLAGLAVPFVSLACAPSPVASQKAPAVPPTEVPIPALPGAVEKPSGTTADRVGKAKELIGAGDYAKAYATLEEAMLIDAKDRDVLRLLAQTGWALSTSIYDEDPAQAYRVMVSASEYLRMLQKAYPELTEEEKTLRRDVLLAEATAHARSMRMEETLFALREAVGAGFADFEKIEKDPDWAGMLGLVEFRKEFDGMKPPKAEGK